MEVVEDGRERLIDFVKRFLILDFLVDFGRAFFSDLLILGGFWGVAAEGLSLILAGGRTILDKHFSVL